MGSVNHSVEQKPVTHLLHAYNNLDGFYPLNVTVLVKFNFSNDTSAFPRNASTLVRVSQMLCFLVFNDSSFRTYCW